MKRRWWVALGLAGGLAWALPAGAVTPLVEVSSTQPAAAQPSYIYDAVQVSAIPSNATTILAYVDGRYRTYAAVKARFPQARILTVSTTGATPANILDVEPGNIQPQGARLWVEAGFGHIIYSDRADKVRLDQALAGLTWQWYAADPTGVAHLVPDSIATQWAWPEHGSPGNYDMSVAATTAIATTTTTTVPDDDNDEPIP